MLPLLLSEQQWTAGCLEGCQRKDLEHWHQLYLNSLDHRDLTIHLCCGVMARWFGRRCGPLSCILVAATCQGTFRPRSLHCCTVWATSNTTCTCCCFNLLSKWGSNGDFSVRVGPRCPTEERVRHRDIVAKPSPLVDGGVGDGVMTQS